MNINQAKAYFTNTLLLAVLCCLYCLVSGLLGVLLGLFISALLAITFYHDHLALGVINSLLIFLLFFLFHSVVPAITLTVPLVLLALALALGTRLKMNFFLLLSLCAFLFLADLLFGMYILQLTAGEPMTLSSMFYDMGRQISETFLAQYEDAAMRNMIQKAVSQAVDTMIMLSPSMFLCFGTVLSGLLIWIYKGMQKKNKVELFGIRSFNTLQADRVFTMIYLVLTFLLFSAPWGMFFSLTANVVVFISFLYVVLGISVFAYKLKRRGMKRGFRLLLLLVVFGLSSTFFMLPVFVLLVAGVLDSFVDYRKLRTKEKEEE